MLFLRGVLSITSFIEGGNYLAYNGFDFSLRNSATVALYLACGTALLIGFLTPVFSGLFCLGVTFSLCFMPSTPCCSHVWCNLPGIYAVVIAISLAIFGPGAFSLDARLFGRREIIIPNNEKQPDS